MLQVEALWLVGADSITGRPRTWPFRTAIAAAMLLDLSNHDLATWQGSTVLPQPATTRRSLLQQARDQLGPTNSPLRACDAIGQVHDHLWEKVAQDLCRQGILNSTKPRMLGLGPRRYRPTNPRTRRDLVDHACRQVASGGLWDEDVHQLVAVLWATGTVEHGLSSTDLTDHSLLPTVDQAMSRDALATQISDAVQYALSPAALNSGPNGPFG